MPSPSDTIEGTTGARAQLLAAATALILERGYSGASVDDVCAAAGVSKGSYYHHFTSKEDLALTVLAEHARRSCEVLESGPWSNVEDGVARALAFMDHVIGLAGSLWGEGCLVGVLAMEMATYGDELREAVAGVFAMLAEKVQPILEPVASAGGAAGPCADELARQLVRTIEGGALLSRCARDEAPVREALTGYRHYLAMLASRQ